MLFRSPGSGYETTRPPWITDLPTPLRVWTVGGYAGASVTHRCPRFRLRPDALRLPNSHGNEIQKEHPKPNRGHFNFALTGGRLRAGERTRRRQHAFGADGMGPAAPGFADSVAWSSNSDGTPQARAGGAIWVLPRWLLHVPWQCGRWMGLKVCLKKGSS